ncbi:CTAG/Pcc1 family [Pilaira anomala]|nr:CTAG/Pcc1 family [Pilaira anomala]
MDNKMFLEIPFANERLATIAQRVMDVDTELRETQVLRIITAEKNILKVEFGCYNTKMLRVAVNSFLEYLTMATRTIEEFDQ